MRYQNVASIVGAAAIAVSIAAAPAAAQEVKGPRYGGTLISVLPDDPPSLCSCISNSFLARMVSPQILEGLLDYEQDLSPKPLLAESWTVSADAKTITFKLRQGVKFHDGKPMTADDVVFSANEVWAKHLADARARMAAAGMTMEKIDSHTVALKMKEPYVYAINYLSSHFGPIVPKHLYEGTDIPKNPANMKPVGTGPFKFAEYLKGSHIALDRNPDYWRKDAQGKRLPYLDRVVMRIMPDATARMLAMTKKDVDYQNFPAFPADQALKLKEQGFSVGAEPIAGIARISRVIVNQRKEHLGKPEVRKALLHAINREEILQKVGYGFGKVSIGPLHQLNPPYKDTINHDVPKYAYDPARANKMLDDAGYKRGADGNRFSITYVLSRGNIQDGSMAELMRDYFKAVGVTLEIEKVDDPTRLARAAKREFDLMSWGPIISGPTPDGLREHWDHKLKDVAQAFSNSGGTNNPKLDDLLQKATVTADVKERNAIWKAWQKEMQDNVHEWYIFDVMIVSVWNPDFVGLPQKVWGHYDAHTFIWWKKGKAA